MKRMYNVKLGYLPTMKHVFNHEDALKYKELIKQKLINMNIEFIDLDWLNCDGMLYNTEDISRIVKKFEIECVDALFCPHCNFGREDAVALLAKKFGKPLLLWGPRDEAPLADGMRLRDTQCGLFATSKILRRLGVPFSYIENCRVDDLTFEEGLKKFLAAACVVKKFKGMRIGQIGTRPQAFWTVMCNEGELLERFGIEIVPITLGEIVCSMNQALKNNEIDLAPIATSFKLKTGMELSDEIVYKMAALKYVIEDWAEKEKLSSIAIQCWYALQEATGLMPCFVNSELTGEGIPVVCETDICGAITAVIAQAANGGQSPVFFADLTARHPENDNAELLWHCGSFPYKLKSDYSEARVSKHYLIDSKCPGVAEWEIRGGDITICRFDGDRGKYSLLAAEGVGIEGPYTRGTYVWVQFKDWPALEKRIINGPYIHHVAGIHGKVAPVIIEALKYIPGIEPDVF